MGFFRLVCVAALVGLCAVPVPGEPLFPTPMFDSGIDNQSMATGDFNNDGMLDTVTSSRQTDRVAVLLGRGDATFGPETQFIIGDKPTGVAVGDFNMDGNLDIACGGSTEQNIAVLLGKGDGDFEVRKLFFLGVPPRSLAVEDFDRDGLPDILASTYSSSLYFLEGRGDGYFSVPVAIPVGTSYDGIAARDLDGDGLTDLAAASPADHRVSIHRGRGDGTFDAAESYDVGQGPVHVHVADLDDDDVLDLVATNHFSDDVSILIGTGGGRFTAGATIPVGDRPRSASSGDLDGDGIQDLVAALEGQDQVAVMRGLGGGLFAPPFHVYTGRVPRSLLVLDLDGDEKTDILVGCSLEVTVLLGKGDGRFEDNAKVPVGDQPGIVRMADLDGDGNLDLVVVNNRSRDVSIALGRGGGEFAAEQRIQFWNIEDLILGDFNGDTVPDLAMANDAYDVVAVLLGLGDGTFGPERRYPVGDKPDRLVMGDLDGNGTLDLAVENNPHFEFDDLSILLGNGDGSFAPEIRVEGWVTRVEIADFDEDGFGDLVHSGDDLVVRFGSADGSFRETVVLSSGRRPVPGDFNNDGSMDVGTARGIYLGDGAGGFVFELFDEYYPFDSAADFDGDGILDLLVGNSVLTIRPRYEDGRFGPETKYLAAPCGNWYDIGDIDGNGSMDIASVGSCEDSVAIMLNRTEVERSVAIDVHPGSDPNIIHVRSRGETAVAVLGRDDLDPRDIDPTALRLGSGGAMPLRNAEIADVDSDGRRDLLVHFRTSEIGVLCGDASVELTGSMRSGQPIRGADSIVTAGCRALRRGARTSPGRGPGKSVEPLSARD